MQKAGYIIGGLLFTLALSAHAQFLRIDSVFSVIEKNHPELKMFNSRIEAYDAYAYGARSLDPPQFGTGFFMTPYNPMYWKAGDMSPSGMGSLMISGQQMFMNPGKREAAYEQMKSMSGMESEMKNFSRNELFGMARMVYYEWVILEKKAVVFGQTEKLMNYLLASAELRYKYGMDKVNGYYKAKGMLGDIQSMKIMNHGEIEQKRIRLNTLMGRNASLEFSIDTNFIFTDHGILMPDSTSIMEIRSDYRYLDRNINMLLKKQKFERSKRLPDFGIRYDHMLAFGTQPAQFSFMAMITIPIVPWSSRMYKSAVTGLGLEIKAIQQMQNALLLEVQSRLADLVSKLLSKKKQVAIYENTILPSMRKNYELVMIAYEQNIEELFMVLDAFQSYKMAQLTRLELLMELANLQAEYEKEIEGR